MDPTLLRRLLRAKDRMDAHSEEDWPVERLAEISCLSPAHFARSFKAAFGIPPHRYLLSRRIERAKSMLRDTDEPITEVAFTAGWLSIGTFGRTFRDVTGNNPATERETLRNTDTPPEIPICILKAAERPQLKSAVLEKRPTGPASENGTPNTDDQDED
jgi:transcriptional regulator GlxA family with amidase domain